MPLTLILATRNPHKVGEIRALLGPHVQCLSLAEFPDAPAVVEDGATFEANAVKKAQSLAQWLRLAPAAAGRDDLNSARVLADDSGLEVDALGGAPGVHSARFAALDSGQPGNSSDAANSEKLLGLLRDIPPGLRSARFRCVLALVSVRPGPAPVVVSGACEGYIAAAARGRGGFGYDPLFLPLGCEQSFAELDGEAKNRLSHRARALAELRTVLELP